MVPPNYTARASRLGSFRSGFHNTSPLILLLAASLLLPVLSGLRTFFADGAWTEIPMKYWLRGEHDDFAAVSWKVDHLKRHPPGGALVVLLGGSSGREAVSSDERITAEFSSAMGRPVNAYNLSCSSQTVAQKIAIVDNLPNVQTTVLIGANLTTFSLSTEVNFQQTLGRELLLNSPALCNLAQANYGGKYPPFGILPGILRFFLSYTRQHFSNLLFRGKTFSDYNMHVYDTEKARTTAEKHKMVKDLKGSSSSENFAFNKEMLQQLLDLCKRRGFDAVIVELPINSALVRDALETQTRGYRLMLNELATSNGVPYMNFNSELPLTDHDFYDIFHLGRTGRALWENKLGESLAGILPLGVVEKGRN